MQGQLVELALQRIQLRFALGLISLRAGTGVSSGVGVADSSPRAAWQMEIPPRAHRTPSRASPVDQPLDHRLVR
ncbi:hypothetical protein [Micromonospora sp. NPDC049679]|uniref:hypothetical protein n=1 Tax=Micromonospora sp. NPDC049679 TaxID=3155920 RepID=UPI0033E04D9F